MRLHFEPERPDEVEVARLLTLDWFLYGEMHVTNANGLTRLDPRGVSYEPPDERNLLTPTRS